MSLIPTTDDEFYAAVHSGKTIFAYFYTDWHENCAEATPYVEELSNEFPDVLFAAMDADSLGFMPFELSIVTFPTVLIFMDGEEKDRLVGIFPKEIYHQVLHHTIEPDDINPFQLIDTMGHRM